mmetsp:Transcript_13130/g.35167  ORF Transcript_13130/g.35167 Transcript_13130/m.35167 type:complete len:299 (-) Transcript_13130:292-1188(-)
MLLCLVVLVHNFCVPLLEIGLVSLECFVDLLGDIEAFFHFDLALLLVPILEMHSATFVWNHHVSQMLHVLWRASAAWPQRLSEAVHVLWGGTATWPWRCPQGAASQTRRRRWRAPQDVLLKPGTFRRGTWTRCNVRRRFLQTWLEDDVFWTRALLPHTWACRRGAVGLDRFALELAVLVHVNVEKTLRAGRCGNTVDLTLLAGHIHVVIEIFPELPASDVAEATGLIFAPTNDGAHKILGLRDNGGPSPQLLLLVLNQGKDNALAWSGEQLPVAAIWIRQLIDVHVHISALHEVGKHV